jgi:hypothetical protein
VWSALAFGVAIGFVILIVSVFSMATEEVTRQGLIVGAIVIVFSCGALLLIRVKVVADHDGIQVVNYVSRRRFAWDDIERFEVGFAYWGVTLVPRSGAPIKLNAVQKSKACHWMHKRGRADIAVDELNTFLAAQIAISGRPDAARPT